MVVHFVFLLCSTFLLLINEVVIHGRVSFKVMLYNQLKLLTGKYKLVGHSIYFGVAICSFLLSLVRHDLMNS